MRKASAVAVVLLLCAQPVTAQTSGVFGLNAMSVNSFFEPSPCSPNTFAVGAGFLQFAIFSNTTATAAAVFIDPCKTSCGFLPFPPACYLGLIANTLDLEACALFALPLGPAGGTGNFTTGLITGIPAGLRFSVQGVILDPGCAPRGFMFTQANDVRT